MSGLSRVHGAALYVRGRFHLNRSLAETVRPSRGGGLGGNETVALAWRDHRAPVSFCIRIDFSISTGVVVGEARGDVVGEADVRTALGTRAARRYRRCTSVACGRGCTSRAEFRDRKSGSSCNSRCRVALTAPFASSKPGNFCEGSEVGKGWLANRSSFGGGSSPPSRLPPPRSRATADKSALWRATSASNHEPRLVAQTGVEPFP
jgi:hypothetical protein